MQDRVEPSKESLVRMAEAMAAASGGALRVARGETDRSTRRDPKTGTFMKAHDVRMGRDMEVYAHMARLRGSWAPVLHDLATDVVMPSRHASPEAYAVGAETLVSMARVVLGEEAAREWRALLGPAEETAPGPGLR